MLFKKPLAKWLKIFTNQPINERLLTIIDIIVTLLGIIATIVGIAVGLQIGLVSSIIIALIILAIIPVIIAFLILVNKYLIKNNFFYTPHTPVTPPNFVGREILLKQLATALEKNESISLIGDRRIGKTSLLKTWQQKVQAQQRPVIYVTGENYEAHNLAAFIKTITKLRCANEPEEAANVLSEWAEEQEKPPLILVDEAERFFENFPPRFFERLPGMLGDVVWIFASCDYIRLVAREGKN